MDNICSICPRKCNINRKITKGYCGVGTNPVLAKAFLHMWEEPCISGTKGSGTVFFSGCSLKCVFCQNFRISQEHFGKEVTIEKLGEIFIKLQDMGAHNINLVNPSHYVPQIKEAVTAAKGLKIPIVYNTSCYDNIDTLKLMEGIVDVYLPDLKYFSSETALRYAKAPDYFKVASGAVKEMYRQVGMPLFDSNGLIKRGLIIRHLILPGLASESIRILEWIKENLSEDIYVSLMSQYTPYYNAGCFPEINRRITRREYEKVVDKLFSLGFENGYVQERESADEEYIPLFNLEGVE